MEEIIIDIKELEEVTVEDEREVVIEEVPVYPEVKDLEVTPSKETQTFKEDGMNYGEVKVLGDEDLQASNIKQGVEIFGVTGSLEELTTETKEGINNQEEIITNQETTLEEINQVIQDKILVKEKFKPRYMYTLTFQNYTGTELDNEVSMLDVTNFTRLSNMFNYCRNLISLDVSNFNTINVKDMSYMFSWCSSLTSLDVSNFNTSNVTNMQSMFASCKELTSLNLKNFDTSNVTNIGDMFTGCNKLETINLSSFNTSKVTNMGYLFSTCNKLIEIDLSNFDTSKVTSMNQMFYMCGSLTKIDIRNFTFDKVTSYSSMFQGVAKDCLIIVKGQTEKEWVLARRSDFTNVKTVAELEG